jgi:hypothetical protein
VLARAPHRCLADGRDLDVSCGLLPGERGEPLLRVIDAHRILRARQLLDGLDGRLLAFALGGDLQRQHRTGRQRRTSRWILAEDRPRRLAVHRLDRREQPLRADELHRIRAGHTDSVRRHLLARGVRRLRLYHGRRLFC